MNMWLQYQLPAAGWQCCASEAADSALEEIPPNPEAFVNLP